MMQERLDQLEKALVADFGEETTVKRMPDGAVVLHLTPETLLDTMKRLRDSAAFDFKSLIDVIGVHYPERDKPLEVVYELLSVYLNHRLRVKVALNEPAIIPSVMGLWKTAPWIEREVYEMFGILFKGHTDLRRLLTEYDFEGFPLRKEFPVTGLYEVTYNTALGKVTREETDRKAMEGRMGRDNNREFYGTSR